MACEVHWLPIDDVVDDIIDRRGVTPLKLGGDFTEQGHRVISAKIVKGGRMQLDADEPRFVDAAIYRKWMKVPLRQGDVIMTSEAPLGELAYLSENVDWALGQRLFAIRTRKTLLDGRFLYYALQMSRVRDDIAGRASGTTVQGIRQTELRRVKVPVPSLAAQTQVASTLGAIDDRIDLLRQTNTTLEAIAQALFKSWFVDFDPVHAKAEGREPEAAAHGCANAAQGRMPIAAMDAATAALFPSEFEESELGLIPKGWTVAALDEAFDINPRRSVAKGSPASYLDMASVPTRGHVPALPIERDFSSGTKFKDGDTLLARITPCLENGKTAHVDFLGDDQVGWGSTEFIVLRPKPPLPLYFGYLLARHDEFRNFAIQAMTGTSGRQRVELGQLKNYKFVYPDESVALEFGNLVDSARSTISANAKRAEILADLRDTLLPRLISGKLRLPEVSGLIEEATA